MEEYINNISNLIGQDKLSDAMELLSCLLKKDEKLDELILQSARLNEIEKQVRLGVVDFQDASVTKNQIRFGILHVVREIEKDLKQGDSHFRNLEIDINDKKRSTNTIINQTHKGSGDNVAGDKIINF